MRAPAGIGRRFGGAHAWKNSSKINQITEAIMADKFDLVAEYREDKGKGASRRLRREGKVPAIIYGGGRPPRSLSFDHNKVLRELQHESFYSSVLNIKVGDKSQAAIVKDLQRHPAKPIIMHIDLQRIVEDEEIKMNIPIHFVGEELAPGVKTGGGSVSHLMTDVEVVCLPKYLPEYFEVDISGLELDDMLHLSDIKLPEGVEIPELAQGPEHDHPIVSIHVLKVAAVEDEEDAGEEAAEGAAPAESDDDETSED
jgi:large subunit ribosomal protein L25